MARGAGFSDTMLTIAQSPTDPAFVADPYTFYDRARGGGPLFWWQDYGLPCAVSHAAVQAILRDRRFGRAWPDGMAPAIPAHLAPFYAVEAHSMLELEPPRHTRLRGLVLHAFTARRIAAMAPDIAALARSLADAMPEGPHDLLDTFARPLPVTIIARLLGVPEEMGPQLLAWSNAMVRMYLAQRSAGDEQAAVAATEAFVAFLRDHIALRRARPGDDLITHLIAAEENGQRLSTDEMIATCILLLNAGHEATVHTIGNGVRLLLTEGVVPLRENAASVTEEILRHDPPLHVFTRIAQEDVTLYGHRFARGDRVQLLLGAANRDPEAWPDPHRFDPARFATDRPQTHSAFGAGLHFCLGAPLARLELQLALPILFARHPRLRLAGAAPFKDAYHFHGLETLPVRSD